MRFRIARQQAAHRPRQRGIFLIQRGQRRRARGFVKVEQPLNLGQGAAFAGGEISL